MSAQSPSADPVASVASEALLQHYPHPDSLSQELINDLRAAAEAFKSHPNSKAADVLAKAFASIRAVIDRAAPSPHEHVFAVGERVILRDLKQRVDLNGCAAVVKVAADDVEGDGRVEVSVGCNRSRETLRVRPSNIRLESALAAEAHAACIGRNVFVSSKEEVKRKRLFQVTSFDPATGSISVLCAGKEGELDEAQLPETICVSVAEAVPAAYSDISKEVLSCAMKVILKAAGPVSTPAVTKLIATVHSCASFYIRCFRDDDASRMCVSVLKLLHSQERSGLLLKDHAERLDWSEKFMSVCVDKVFQEMLNYSFFEAAVPMLLMCKQMMEESAGLDSAIVAVICNNLASLYQRLDKLDQALELYNRSVEVHSKLFGRDSLRVADKLYNCALLHTTLEHFSEAEAMYNEALQTRERHHGRDSLEVGDVLTGLSALLQHQERLDEAEKLCAEVLRISQLRTGRESLQVAQSLHNLAGIHHKRHQFHEARAMYTEALRIKQMKLGRESLEVARAKVHIADVCDSQGLHTESEALYVEVLQAEKLQVGGGDTLQVAEILAKIAHLQVLQARFTEAEQAYNEVLRIQRLKLGPDSSTVAGTLGNAASVFFGNGRAYEAEVMYHDAMRIYELKFGPDCLQRATTMFNLALLYQKGDFLQRAESLLRQALRIQEHQLGAGHKDAQRTRRLLEQLHPPELSDIAPDWRLSVSPRL